MNGPSTNEKPSILLVQPAAGQWEAMQGLAPPVGLLSAARLVASEFDVRIFDQRLHPRDWRRVLGERLRDRPLLVGLTAMIGPQIGAALEIADAVREHSAQSPIVWGGVHPGMEPESTVRDRRVDVVVRGEGEVTLLELARALRDGRPLTDVPGLTLPSGGEPVSMPARPMLDLNDLPDLPYEKVDLQRYVTDYRQGRTIPFESSRGCPYGCSFCYGRVIHHSRWRALTADRTCERLLKLKTEYDLDTVYFLDDNPFVDRGRILEIAGRISRAGLRWFNHGLSPKDVRHWSDEDLKTLADSGCIELGVGLESGSDRVLRTLGKSYRSDEVYDFNRRLGRTGARISYGFMAGIPGETADDVRQTVGMIRRLLDENPAAYVKHVSCYMPLPGTPLAKKAVEHGFVVPKDLADWVGVDFLVTKMPWLSPRGKKEINGLAFVTVFLRPDRLKQQGIDGWLPSILGRLYAPVARWRLRRHAFGWMIELRAARFLEGLLDRNPRDSRDGRPDRIGTGGDGEPAGAASGRR